MASSDMQTYVTCYYQLTRIRRRPCAAGVVLFGLIMAMLTVSTEADACHEVAVTKALPVKANNDGEKCSSDVKRFCLQATDRPAAAKCSE